MQNQPSFVGRYREIERFRRLLKSNESEFIGVYGRRRVGKTQLIREATKGALALEFTGTQGGSLSEQLENFAIELGRASSGKFPQGGVPKSWQEAFRQLAEWCETLPKKKKFAIFFDELPWLAGPRSRFLSALGYFWNTWGTRHGNLLLIVCGSAASWMIRKLLHDKGGLHNRLTDRMRLEPFDLKETREFLQSRRIKLTDHQVIEIYMAFGGVPLYLEQARRGESAAQMIDRVCFAKDGLLRDEFGKLYAALFDSPERHIAIVRALASKPSGLTRGEIATAADQSPSGRFTTTLEELEESGFIRSSTPHGKQKRETLYRLSDEYTLFYLKWIERRRGAAKGAWQKARGTPKWRTWSGYAFEDLCMKHAGEIEAALGIAGVQTEHSSWRYQPKAAAETGGQIDMLIDRADSCINLCEMKFSDAEFVIDKRYAKTLRERRETFRRVTKTKKNLFLTFVTTHGVKKNGYGLELTDAEVTITSLFA